MVIKSKIEYSMSHDVKGPTTITGNTCGIMDDVLYLLARAIVDISKNSNRKTKDVLMQIAARTAAIEFMIRNGEDRSEFHGVRFDPEMLKKIIEEDQGND